MGGSLGRSKAMQGAGRRGRDRANTYGDRCAETLIGAKITPQDDGCWLWNGQADRYGQVIINSHGHRYRVIVHRFVYETLVGEIPDGFHLHHECRTPGCCNPAHLVALSAKDHARRHVELRRAS